VKAQHKTSGGRVGTVSQKNKNVTTKQQAKSTGAEAQSELQESKSKEQLTDGPASDNCDFPLLRGGHFAMLSERRITECGEL
jgi:hypothetical protein